ncbi:unnamed protein product [Ilex paraguariensis]|uniref:Dof-type domain-containing protein n=1 Tax=Ilex paraguariensis TaxID=185542 RepID=A0ABC8QVQ8_9AQUA
MSEVKDSAIKLFGKTIQLSPEEGVSCAVTTTKVDSDHHDQHSSNANTSLVNKKPSGEELLETEEDDDSSHQVGEVLIATATSSGITEDPKTPSDDRENLKPKATKEEDSNETNDSQEKTLKKPDKIIPCPRCNSMDTKFCYYNNYNVNQPRHFCKNCQRYWTAGGTMRNVPVGSGRRKNKSAAASHYCQIIVSEALQAAQADPANGIHHPTLKPNGTVLTFGSDAPLCKSMVSVLNLAEKSQNHVGNGFHGPEQSIPDSCGGGENGDDQSGGSSSSASNLTEKGSNAGLQDSMIKNFQVFPSPVQCIPGPPWHFPGNSGQWRSPMPPPAFGPSGFPVSFYPAPTYWGSTVSSPWNMPWVSPPPSSPDHSGLSSRPNSPTLGKHSRDGNMLKLSNLEKDNPLQDKNTEGFVWIPKTLRIDDPSKAAKSSIWSTLGIKNEKTSSINGGSLFKAFQPKGKRKNHIDKTSLVLQANPAALSRSLNFHEST